MGDIKKSSEEQEEKKSPNEERIRKICLLYYSRPDIRKAMYDFSKNRECVPRYFEGFGKRPDSFQYDSDILELAKKGATSFHSSEELWEDPLQISTELKENEIKALRQGWDLLIDIDSKYLDYSKIYAEILIEVLKSHGIKNIGVKFSGSKGLHIIVPWKAFPKEISGKKTSDMFPEWPRLICQYLNSKIAEKLKDRIIDSHDNVITVRGV
jgi:DNA primase catalytic subunit